MKNVWIVKELQNTGFINDFSGDDELAWIIIGVYDNEESAKRAAGAAFNKFTVSRVELNVVYEDGI
jgi:hypothetical protein